MSLQDLWVLARKKHPKPTFNGRNLEELEDKELSRLERKNELELQRLQILELKRMKANEDFARIRESLTDGGEDDFEDGEDSEESALMQLLTPIISNIAQKGAGTPPLSSRSVFQHPTEEQPPIMTDEDIRSFLASQPRAYLKVAKKLPPGLLRRKILQTMPMTEGEYERSHKILMEEF
jgi:hypothetical protein